MTNYRPDNVGLAELIDRILDKGLVINADIKIDLAGTEILGIKLRAALASFETAAKFGLAFPSGTNLNAPAWQYLGIESEACPQCGRQIFTTQQQACSCGWEKLSIKQENNELLEVQQNESTYPKSRIETH
ncbi:MAG: gas vesicle protein [Nanoarchaeota archaeon]